MGIYRAVTQHFGWKVASFLLAVAVWGLVRWMTLKESSDGREDAGLMATRVYQNVPILISQQATRFREYTIQPEYVSVKVRARSALLEATPASRIRVTLDLTEPPSSSRFRAPLQCKLPDRIDLMFVEPLEVVVTAESETGF